MACARCGCGVYHTEDIITLNKIWHKCCFTCYRCKKRLDKCTAKIYQGEVFCARCYNCLLREIELISSPPSKPCRVVSSPSCTCEKECPRLTKVLPPFQTPKKYQICFLTNQQLRIVKSCSYIPDKIPGTGKKELYCFAFPLPKEVANYYNFVQTMPKPKQSSANCCCTENRPKKPNNIPPCAKIRSLPQQPPCLICRENFKPTPPAQTFPKCCTCSPFNPRPPPPTCCCLPQSSCCCESPFQENYPTQPPEDYSPPCPPQREKCRCPKCCPPPRCKVHSFSPKSSVAKTSRNSVTRKPCPVCCPEANRKQENTKKPPPCRCCPAQEENIQLCACKTPKYCPGSNQNNCECRMCEVRAICTPICNRCGCKVYAAEKISASKGAYHVGCFSCFCCRKPLEVKNFFENCGEIYCKQCYNSIYGNQLYGYGSSCFC